MSLPQSILAMVFCMTVVFTVLIALWGVIRLFTCIVQLFEKKSIDTANPGAE